MRSLLAAIIITLSTAVGAVTWAVAQMPPAHTPDPAISDGSAQRALDAAKVRWRSNGPASYRFRVGRSCFCPAEYRDPRTVVVRGGRPVRPPEQFKDVATIPRLFRVVRRAIDDGAAHLTVRYDSRYGYPRAISIDSRELIADEEQSYTVDRLVALKPRR